MSCRKTLSCDRQDISGVKLHCSRDSGKFDLYSRKQQRMLKFQSSPSMNEHDKNIAKAEVKIVNFFV